MRSNRLDLHATGSHIREGATPNMSRRARPSPRRWIGFVLIGVVTILIVVLAVAFGGNRAGSGLELVGYLSHEMGTDFQFQRRSGAHIVDGASVTTATDLVFAGADDGTSRGDGGIEVIDITDPSNPRRLTRIPCPGYQSDVAIHEAHLLQAIDSSAANTGCDRAWLESSGSLDVDQSGTTGVRIFDVTDPARPKLVDFVEVASEEFVQGVHNLTVVPWAGVAYLAELDGQLGILDLTQPTFPYTAIEVTSISHEMETSCHDIGLDPVRMLAFCPASVYETYVLDVADPVRPVYVSKIVNEGLSSHHGARMAPDGVTLVLQAEYDHPPPVANDAAAGLWFYDLSDPTHPELLGSWAPGSCVPSERAERACSSHWFGFIPGTQMVAAGWRHEGVFVVDYTDPANPVEAGSFRPGGPGVLGLRATPDFWSAYFWRGHLYAHAGDFRAGLYVLSHADITDEAPSPYEEGISWGRWTAPAPSARPGSATPAAVP